MRIVHGHQVGVTERSEHLHLGPLTVDRIQIGEFDIENLRRNRTVQQDIGTPVNLSCPAATDQLVQPVPPIQHSTLDQGHAATERRRTATHIRFPRHLMRIRALRVLKRSHNAYRKIRMALLIARRSSTERVEAIPSPEMRVTTAPVVGDHLQRGTGPRREVRLTVGRAVTWGT